jgi:hypothetical protein
MATNVLLERAEVAFPGLYCPSIGAVLPVDDRRDPSQRPARI